MIFFVWCGVLPCDMVWCGMILCDVWCCIGVMFCGMVGIVWYGVMLDDVVWYGIVWYGVVWWYCMLWYCINVAWCCMMWLSYLWWLSISLPYVLWSHLWEQTTPWGQGCLECPPDIGCGIGSGSDRDVGRWIEVGLESIWLVVIDWFRIGLECAQ